MMKLLLNYYWGRKMSRMTHEEFVEKVEEASSLPAQTKKALGPESDEDRAMDEDNVAMNPDLFATGKTTEIVKIKFAEQKGGE